MSNSISDSNSDEEFDEEQLAANIAAAHESDDSNLADNATGSHANTPNSRHIPLISLNDNGSQATIPLPHAQSPTRHSPNRPNPSYYNNEATEKSDVNYHDASQAHGHTQYENKGDGSESSVDETNSRQKQAEMLRYAVEQKTSTQHPTRKAKKTRNNKSADDESSILSPIPSRKRNAQRKARVLENPVELSSSEDSATSNKESVFQLIQQYNTGKKICSIDNDSSDDDGPDISMDVGEECNQMWVFAEIRKINEQQIVAMTQFENNNSINVKEQQARANAYEENCFKELHVVMQTLIKEAQDLLRKQREDTMDLRNILKEKFTQLRKDVRFRAQPPSCVSGQATSSVSVYPISSLPDSLSQGSNSEDSLSENSSDVSSKASSHEEHEKSEDNSDNSDNDSNLLDESEPIPSVPKRISKSVPRNPPDMQKQQERSFEAYTREKIGDVARQLAALPRSNDAFSPVSHDVIHKRLTQPGKNSAASNRPKKPPKKRTKEENESLRSERRDRVNAELDAKRRKKYDREEKAVHTEQQRKVRRDNSNLEQKQMAERKRELKKKMFNTQTQSVDTHTPKQIVAKPKRKKRNNNGSYDFKGESEKKKSIAKRNAINRKLVNDRMLAELTGPKHLTQEGIPIEPVSSEQVESILHASTLTGDQILTEFTKTELRARERTRLELEIARRKDGKLQADGNVTDGDGMDNEGGIIDNEGGMIDNQGGMIDNQGGLAIENNSTHNNSTHNDDNRNDDNQNDDSRQPYDPRGFGFIQESMIPETQELGEVISETQESDEEVPETQ